MIQVSILASMPLKGFGHNAWVELTDPIVGAVAAAAYQGTDAGQYIKTDNIVLTRDFSSFKAQPRIRKEPIRNK